MSTDAASSDQIVATVRSFVLLYKIPLFFVVLGIVLVGAAVRVVWGQQPGVPAVVFDTQATASAAASLGVRVDVAGAVRHPGVYALEAGSRVDDALTAAGGVSDKADGEWMAKQLNRAAKLVDGGKIYIPSHQEQAAAGVAGIESHQVAGVPTLVNINRASQAELEALPGIGPTTAGKIISGRPYQSIDELKTKKILGASVFGKVKDLLTL